MVHMALSKSRMIAVGLSAVAIVSNSLSAYIFHHLPDDPYHLSFNFSAYSYFSISLSVLGLVGSLREHAFSVAVFGNYLIIDTFLCAVPRFLFMMLFSDFQERLCGSSPPLQFQHGQTPSSFASMNALPLEQQTGIWSEVGLSKQDCLHVAWILQVVVIVGVVGTTFVQIVFALEVRSFANRLFSIEQAKAELLDVANLEQSLVGRGRSDDMKVKN